MEEWKEWWKSTGNPLVKPHIIEGGPPSLMEYGDAKGTAEHVREKTIEIILVNLESITKKLTKLETEVVFVLPAKMEALKSSQQGGGGAAGGKKRRSSKRRRRKTRRC